MPFTKGNQLGKHNNHVSNVNPLAAVGKKWIHRDGFELRVAEDELNVHLADGWIIGRIGPSEETRRRQSEAQKKRDPSTRGSATYWRGKRLPEEVRAKLRKPKTILGKLEKYGVTPEIYADAKTRGLKWCVLHKQFEPKENFNNPESGNPCRRARKPGQSKLPGHRHKSRLWSRYRITPERYAEILSNQGGHCALCPVVPNGKRLAVDHNHQCCAGRNGCGKCNRGLLCSVCNQNLGRLEDLLTQGTIIPNSETWLAKALQYLSSYSDLP